jgi:hypothetical protein
VVNTGFGVLTLKYGNSVGDLLFVQLSVLDCSTADEMVLHYNPGPKLFSGSFNRIGLYIAIIVIVILLVFVALMRRNIVFKIKATFSKIKHYNRTVEEKQLIKIDENTIELK